MHILTDTDQHLLKRLVSSFLYAKEIGEKIFMTVFLASKKSLIIVEKLIIRFP